jgi:hypothetical protein
MRTISPVPPDPWNLERILAEATRLQRYHEIRTRNGRSKIPGIYYHRSLQAGFIIDERLNLVITIIRPFSLEWAEHRSAERRP